MNATEKNAAIAAMEKTAENLPIITTIDHLEIFAPDMAKIFTPIIRSKIEALKKRAGKSSDVLKSENARVDTLSKKFQADGDFIAMFGAEFPAEIEAVKNAVAALKAKTDARKPDENAAKTKKALESEISALMQSVAMAAVVAGSPFQYNLVKICE